MVIKKTRLVLASLAVLSVNGVMAKEVTQEDLLNNAKFLVENVDKIDKLEDATTLCGAGVTLRKAGQYEKSELLLQRSLMIREKNLDKNHPDIAQSLNHLAELYRIQGKYEQAEPLFHRSLVILEKALGKNHLNVAIALNNLALLYKIQRKFQQAESLYQRSLAIYEKSPKENQLSIAGNLNNLAGLYLTQDKDQQAESLYQRSLAIYEKSPKENQLGIADSLSNLAVLYKTQRKYAQAESFALRSLAIYEKALNVTDTVRSLNNLAGIYIDQGNYEKAEPLYLKSLAIHEKILGKDNPNIIHVLNGLASLYGLQGKYEQAEMLTLRSIAITKKTFGENSLEIVPSLSNLGSFYKEHYKLKEAETLFKKNLTILENTVGTNHPLYVSNLNQLASIYTKLGKIEAGDIYLYGLKIQEETLGKNHPDVALTLNNLAVFYFAQGKYEQAEPLFERGLAIYEETLGKNHPSVIENTINLATIYIKQDKLDKAIPFLQKNLRATNQNFDHLLWGAGEKTRKSYLAQENIKDDYYYVSKRDFYLNFYTLANTPEEALYFSLSRKNLLLRIASEASSLAKQSHDPSVKKQKQQLDALRTQLATFAFSGKADKTKIEALEEQANQLEMQLSQKVAGFKHTKTDVTPKDVFSKLTDKQALIDFLVYTELDFKNQKLKTEQVIALLADNKDVRLIKLGELAPISKAIKSYQANIVLNDASNKQREQQLQHSAKTLYQQLWQPLAEYLKDKTTVYVVPDGELNLLPFKALQNDQGQYLSNKQQLIMLSSARDLVLPPLTAKTQATAIFADPDYGGQTNATVNTAAVDLKDIHFSPLPNTLIEAKQLQQRLQQQKIPAKLFTEKNATEQAVKNLSSPKILHLATHGFFLEQLQPDKKTLEQNLTHTVLHVPQAYSENPLTRSGLALVNANLSTQDNTKNDGILTALEVLNLKLEGTDLVTLSACETSRGDIKIGEGVYSLNRAFQEAGAKAVLSTLWEINDGATVEFMQKFYRRFLTEQSAQQALQETQQEFMQYDKFKDPFYWAGFVVFGTK